MTQARLSENIMCLSSNIVKDDKLPFLPFTLLEKNIFSSYLENLQKERNIRFSRSKQLFSFCSHKTNIFLLMCAVNY